MKQQTTATGCVPTPEQTPARGQRARCVSNVESASATYTAPAGAVHLCGKLATSLTTPAHRRRGLFGG